MLRDYQTDIIERLREAWQTHRSVMVQMPTGTGKTHVLVGSSLNSLTPAPSPRGEGRNMPMGFGAKEVCRDIQQTVSNSDRQAVSSNYRMAVSNNDGQYVSNNDGHIWIIAHRRELVAQIEETLARYGIKTEDGREDKGKGRIKVMSIQWLTRHREDVRREPELIVIDEAHHAQAQTYRMLWDRYPRARFLGLTATPCRMNRSGFTDLFDVLVTSWSVAEFIGRGVLSTFDYVSIRQGSEEQRLIDSLEKRGADGDYQIKEMNGVLNRDISIARLYRSMEQFAAGKKGIVYAISIDHARNIAAYYNKKGVSAVAIDSRTPAPERKLMVTDFKAGRIRVLVNVDVFSEGFDCPDVEFVQMARPTLSQAKYLQQVGRGLRKVKGKEACVLIDNVGLYRMFGLPTAAWDWQAMFRGEQAGRGTRADRQRTEARTETIKTERNTDDNGLETIVSHDELLSLLPKLISLPAAPSPKAPSLRAWQDKASGLWGLRRGRQTVTAAVFLSVADIRYDMAIVRLSDRSFALIGADGNTILTKDRYRTMRFARNHFITARTADGKDHYIDLLSLRTYDRRPETRRYGSIELLRAGRVYYSRTRSLYVNSQNITNDYISRHGFYVAILDCNAPAPLCSGSRPANGCRWGYACLLDGDTDSYYWIDRRLSDGSIIVTDNDGRVYHATADAGKRHIGHRHPEEEADRCRDEIARLSELADRKLLAAEAAKEEQRQRLLDRHDGATPFRSGMKWGLKVGNHVTIPPIYRSIKSPVGKYCAVEKNYSQWGVIAVDGTLMIEPRYSDIEISAYGAVTMTKVTGNKVHLQLP